MVVIVLVLCKKIGSVAFLAEIETMIFILMCILNINALIWYCRNAGNPYHNDKYKRYVHKFKFVVVYWNFAFITKLIFSNVGVNITDFDGSSDDPDVSSDDFWYSIETFANIMISEIIPLYFVIDNKFIKIFTMQFLDK